MLELCHLPCELTFSSMLTFLQFQLFAKVLYFYFYPGAFDNIFLEYRSLFLVKPLMKSSA